MPAKDHQTPTTSEEMVPRLNLTMRPGEPSTLGIEFRFSIRIDVSLPGDWAPGGTRDAGRLRLTEDGEAGTKEAGRGLKSTEDGEAGTKEAGRGPDPSTV